MKSNLFSHNINQHCRQFSAQAGIRYSLKSPERVESNLLGFLIYWKMLNLKCKKLIFASSSSVYGHSEDVPYKVDGSTDEPVSCMQQQRRVISFSIFYNNIYKIPTIGLRFLRPRPYKDQTWLILNCRNDCF